jgi:hypothetical protein
VGAVWVVVKVGVERGGGVVRWLVSKPTVYTYYIRKILLPEIYQT